MDTNQLKINQKKKKKERKQNFWHHEGYGFARFGFSSTDYFLMAVFKLKKREYCNAIHREMVGVIS